MFEKDIGHRVRVRVKVRVKVRPGGLFEKDIGDICYEIFVTARSETIIGPVRVSVSVSIRLSNSIRVGIRKR